MTRVQINFDPSLEVPMSKTLDASLRPYFPESNWNEFVTACYGVSQEYKDACEQSGKKNNKWWIVVGIGAAVMIFGFIYLAKVNNRGMTPLIIGIAIFFVGIMGSVFSLGGYDNAKTKVKENLNAVCEEASAKLTSVSIRAMSKTEITIARVVPS